MTDSDFLHAQIAAGDADAFGQWLAAAEPRVRGSLASFARVVDTEAVLQEALVRVWQVAPLQPPVSKRSPSPSIVSAYPPPGGVIE